MTRRVSFSQIFPCERLLISCSMDTVSKIERSVMMSNISSTNTKPEIAVRSVLHELGFRFRLHRRDLPGKPDVVLPRHRKIIFVHGCFWHGHGCKRSSTPKTNQDYWGPKISRNRSRDLENRSVLMALGWSVLEVWECETTSADKLRQKLLRFMAAVRKISLPSPATVP
jgi:DNA mismatch endonuclease, patch repair protein